MVGFVPGVERQIASARSAQRHKPICIPLTAIERKFLLFRLADRTRSIEAVLHAQRVGETISPWTRDQVANKLSILIDTLRLGRDLLVITHVEKLLIVQGIAENPYFQLMHPADPRLTVDALRQADALRRKLAAAIGMPIGKVKLGAGRMRLEA